MDKHYQTEQLKKLSTGELLEIADYIIKCERDILYGEFPTLKTNFKDTIDEGSRIERTGSLSVIFNILYYRSLDNQYEED
ncbi:hypothetical protein [Anabaena azotica]|uniref:hypothetical protein n=1 Tax=Anabaena azotica TaxID=197653 RepID=UPI0039A623F8